MTQMAFIAAVFLAAIGTGHIVTIHRYVEGSRVGTALTAGIGVSFMACLLASFMLMWVYRKKD